MKSLIILLITSLLLMSCASKKKAKADPEPTGKSTLIGMIEMVNPEQNYVLIRCDQMPSIQPGTELTALSNDGKKTKLILSPERKGHYLTADIKEGSPEVSNLVLLIAGNQPATAPTAAPAPAAPPSSGRSPGMSMPTLPDIPASLLDPNLNKALAPTDTTTQPARPMPAPGAPVTLDDLEPVVNGDAKP